MKFIGKVWKFGNDIDTDVIIPARYLHSTDPDYLGQHCMEPIRPGFPMVVQKGDIIVAGTNFGCGSSREHAPIAIKACGISAVIAKSFARIFFRNAINIGLPVIESLNLAGFVKEGEKLRVDLTQGYITHVLIGKKYKISPFPEFLQKIINAGGLMNYYSKNKDYPFACIKDQLFGTKGDTFTPEGVPVTSSLEIGINEPKSNV